MRLVTRRQDRDDGLFLAFIAHFGAVLFHTLILRDRLFSRMAPYRVPAR
jgi:cytochrome b561